MNSYITDNGMDMLKIRKNMLIASMSCSGFAFVVFIVTMFMSNSPVYNIFPMIIAAILYVAAARRIRGIQEYESEI